VFDWGKSFNTEQVSELVLLFSTNNVFLFKYNSLFLFFFLFSFVLLFFLILLMIYAIGPTTMVDVWEEGYALKELAARTHALSERREELERRKKRLANIRKKFTTATKKGQGLFLFCTIALPLLHTHFCLFVCFVVAIIFPSSVLFLSLSHLILNVSYFSHLVIFVM
jgi:hypothetical protein